MILEIASRSIIAYDPALPDSTFGALTWRKGDPVYVNYFFIKPEAPASTLVRMLCLFRQHQRGRLIQFHHKVRYHHRMRKLTALMGAKKSDDGHYYLQL